MTGPATVVTTSESPQSAGSPTSTGTVFLVAPAAYGPETPTLVQSLGAGVALYGPREGESVKAYDALNTIFALKGSRVYFKRVSGEGAAAAAKLELETTGKKKTLTVSAKYKGTFGNGIKIEVKEAESKTKLAIYSPEGELLETSGEYAKAEELLAWGKSHEAFVVLGEAGEYATGKAEKLEKLASTKLAGGTNPTNNQKSTIAGIESFGRELGPGTLIVPGNTEEAVHTAMAEHCVTVMKNLRVCAPDLKLAAEANATVAGLEGEKGTYATALSQNMIFCASAVIVQGVTLGTTRVVPASTVIAGLRAQVSQTGNDNQAPAGEEWPLSPYVLGFVNTFSQEQLERLSTAGINVFKELQGKPCLYGFVSAVSREKDIIFWQFSAACERMALVAQAEVLGNRYLFKTIDGRKRLISRFQGDLQGVIKRHWEAGALFGETSPEAGVVNVGEPVNTPTTLQNGELNAEMQVRISPYANLVQIGITSTPITVAV